MPYIFVCRDTGDNSGIPKIIRPGSPLFAVLNTIPLPHLGHNGEALSTSAITSWLGVLV